MHPAIHRFMFPSFFFVVKAQLNFQAALSLAEAVRQERNILIFPLFAALFSAIVLLSAGCEAQLNESLST
jgi:hypothetical protein